MTAPEVMAGVDLGGSKVRVAVARCADGTVVAEHVEPTVDGDADDLLRQLTGAVHRVIPPGTTVTSLAVGSPGLIRPDGTVALASNVRGLHELPLASSLSTALGIPVVVENDANVAAIGEGAQGAAVGCATYAVLSIGTGVGCGLIVDGRIVRGHRGAAGEVAFLPLGAPTGSPATRAAGALELAASGPAFERAAARRFGRRVSASEVLSLAAQHDLVAVALVADEAALIGAAIMAIVAVIDPEVVVLTGGLGSNHLLLAPVRETFAQWAPHQVDVRTSPLGDRAGVVGALALARQMAG
jgi:glucokinase